MNALATIRQAPGLDRYLDLLEHRLEDAVSAIPGRLGEVGADTLAAGGKRLRPLLVFLSTPAEERDGERAVAGGAAVELVHMATLVHDDLLDGADLRRGRPTVWAEHGEATARAAGDYLFARAFAQLAATGDAEAVAILSEATLALARGEALQRRQAFRPETSVDDYLARCSLKTGKLFEAACLLGSGMNGAGLGAFGLALGIAFQIAETSTRPGRWRGSTCATARRLSHSSSRRAGTSVWRGRSPARTSPMRSTAWRRPARSTRPANSRSAMRPRHVPRSTAGRTARRWRP
jgi:hypothetical protein